MKTELVGWKNVYHGRKKARIVKGLRFAPQDFLRVPAGATLEVTVRVRLPKKKRGQERA